MKKAYIINRVRIAIVFCVLVMFTNNSFAQEKYGKALNIGAGINYWGGVPLTLNYEFDVAKNFTLAPFISFYSYRYNSYWVNGNNGRYYYYRTTTVPMGVKGSYYFDELFKAEEKWDFYGAASLGLAIRRNVYESGFGGGSVGASSGLYWNAHIGAEYHLKENLGLFLDLSTGMSSIGLSIKMK